MRYFSCEPFHGLFVPPNKARLNLSGDSKFGEVMFSGSSRRLSGNFTGTPVKNQQNSAFGAIGTTPNHLDRIENFQMDFSAVKDISDSFGNSDVNAAVLKTPTANVKSQHSTPATNELKNTQNEIYRLRDQIMTIKADLGSGNREKIDEVVNKLSGMLETYEQVSTQYENQLKQFLMARKASKLDSSGSDDLINRLNQEKSQLLNEHEKIRVEYEKVRNDLYKEIKENDSIKSHLMNLEDENARLKQKISKQEEEIQKRSYENAKTRTELEIEQSFEEENRKRSIEHENELKILKSRHEEEMRQKKLIISDLQNEVAFLKQSEKVLEEELNSRRHVNGAAQDTSKLADQLFDAKKQAEDFKRLWEDAQASKMRSEEYYRGELERVRKEFSDNGQYEELKRDLKELGNRLKQTRADNEELTWALETSRKETERLNGLIEEQAHKLSDREKKLAAFSGRIQELENQELESHKIEGLQAEIKRLTFELGEEKVKATGPIEQLSSLKRKIALIEREKELLEEQVRSARLSAYSQGEFQTFSTFIQGLKRHIDAEILSIEPLKLTLQDVVRAKEMVDILLKVTEDVRLKVLNHLSQVEEVIRSRFSQPSQTEPSIGNTTTDIETVKVERIRNYEPSTLSDLRRRIDFRTEPNIPLQSQSQSEPLPMRTLREPLGVTSVPSASNLLSSSSQGRSITRSSSNDQELENRMNNFRNLVSDLRLRANNPSSNSSSYYGYNNNPPSSVTASRSNNTFVRAHEPVRCNLCQEYGHDALSCPDYLSGTETFSEDNFLRDLRNSKFNSRFAERTRV